MARTAVRGETLREFFALTNFDFREYLRQTTRLNVKGAAEKLGIALPTFHTWIDRAVCPLAVWNKCVALWGPGKVEPTIERLTNPFRLPRSYAAFISDQPDPAPPPVYLTLNEELLPIQPEPPKANGWRAGEPKEAPIVVEGPAAKEFHEFLERPTPPTPAVTQLAGPDTATAVIAYLLEQLVQSRMDLVAARSQIEQQTQQLLDLEKALHKAQEDYHLAAALVDTPTSATTPLNEASQTLLESIATQRGVAKDLRELLPKRQGSS